MTRLASGTEIAEVLFHAHRFAEAVRESRSEAAVRPDDAMVLWGILDSTLSLMGNPKKRSPSSRTLFRFSNGSPGVIGVFIERCVLMPDGALMHFVSSKN